MTRRKGRLSSDARWSAADGGLATIHGLGLHAPRGEHLDQDAAVGVVVVDNQDRQVADDIGISGLRPSRDVIGESEAACEMECAAAPDFTFEPKFPAHEGDEAGGDGESESRSAVLARGGCVGLSEGVENDLLLFWRNSDSGVVHLEMQQ